MKTTIKLFAILFALATLTFSCDHEEVGPGFNGPVEPNGNFRAIDKSDFQTDIEDVFISDETSNYNGNQNITESTPVGSSKDHDEE